MEGLIDNLDTLIAFGKLNPPDREALIDNALVGITQREIAVRDGVSHSTVERRIKRAKRDLARELAWNV